MSAIVCKQCHPETACSDDHLYYKMNHCTVCGESKPCVVCPNLVRHTKSSIFGTRTTVEILKPIG